MHDTTVHHFNMLSLRAFCVGLLACGVQSTTVMHHLTTAPCLQFKTSLDHAVLRTLAHNATVIKQKIGRESDGISGGIRRNDDDKTRLSLISDVGSSGFQLVTKKMAMKAAAGMRKEAVSALEQKRYGGGSSPRSSLKWRRQAR
jgi:hypothetical protein